MVTAIDFGVLRVLKNGNWDSIALTGGFAEVESNEVTVLVNKAEMGKNIDSVKAEAELEQAKNQLSKTKDKNTFSLDFYLNLCYSINMKNKTKRYD